MSERIRGGYDDALYKSTFTLLYFTLLKLNKIRVWGLHGQYSPGTLPSAYKFIGRIGNQYNYLLSSLEMFIDCSFIILICVSLFLNNSMFIHKIINFLNLSF